MRRFLLPFGLAAALLFGCDDDPALQRPDVSDLVDLADGTSPPDELGPDEVAAPDATDSAEVHDDADLVDLGDGPNGDTDLIAVDVPDPDLDLHDLPPEIAEDIVPEDILDQADSWPSDVTESDQASDSDAAFDARLEGIYANLELLRDSQLEAGLRTFVGSHVPLTYDEARDEIYGVDGGLGIDLLDGTLTCAYTGRTLRSNGTSTNPSGTCTLLDGSQTGCGFNTEHSWPSSLLKPSHDPIGRGDIHHLFPTWSVANNQRGSYLFGLPTCTPPNCSWQEGGSYLGRNANNALVFHVRMGTRGDIARAQFYMAVRYGMDIPPAVETLLRQWHLDDPVDAIEAARNDAIELVQNNRNPFVDRPDFVDLITDF